MESHTETPHYHFTADPETEIDCTPVLEEGWRVGAVDGNARTGEILLSLYKNAKNKVILGSPDLKTWRSFDVPEPLMNLAFFPGTNLIWGQTYEFCGLVTNFFNGSTLKLLGKAEFSGQAMFLSNQGPSEIIKSSNLPGARSQIEHIQIITGKEDRDFELKKLAILTDEQLAADPAIRVRCGADSLARLSNTEFAIAYDYNSPVEQKSVALFKICAIESGHIIIKYRLNLSLDTSIPRISFINNRHLAIYAMLEMGNEPRRHCLFYYQKQAEKWEQVLKKEYPHPDYFHECFSLPYIGLPKPGSSFDSIFDLQTGSYVPHYHILENRLQYRIRENNSHYFYYPSGRNRFIRIEREGVLKEELMMEIREHTRVPSLFISLVAEYACPSVLKSSFELKSEKTPEEKKVKLVETQLVISLPKTGSEKSLAGAESKIDCVDRSSVPLLARAEVKPTDTTKVTTWASLYHHNTIPASSPAEPPKQNTITTSIKTKPPKSNRCCC